MSKAIAGHLLLFILLIWRTAPADLIHAAEISQQQTNANTLAPAHLLLLELDKERILQKLRPFSTSNRAPSPRITAPAARAENMITFQKAINGAQSGRPRRALYPPRWLEQSRKF